MEHDHDVRSVAQRFHVAGLLVAAVAHVVRMADGLEVQALGELRRLVAREVVDDDDLVEVAFRDPAERVLERLGRVVGGHDDDDEWLARGAGGRR